MLELLTRLGNHVRIMFRVSCVPSVEENPASRLNDYFRDELTSDKDPDSCYYLYQKEGMVYGLYQDGSWQFGMKVKTAVNFVFSHLTVTGGFLRTSPTTTGFSWG